MDHIVTGEMVKADVVMVKEAVQGAQKTNHLCVLKRVALEIIVVGKESTAKWDHGNVVYFTTILFIQSEIIY